MRYLILFCLITFGNKGTAENHYKTLDCEEIFLNPSNQEKCKNDFSEEETYLMADSLEDLLNKDWDGILNDPEKNQALNALKLISISSKPLSRTLNTYDIYDKQDFLEWYSEVEKKQKLPNTIQVLKKLMPKSTMSDIKALAQTVGIKYPAKVRVVPHWWMFWKKWQDEWIILDLGNKENVRYWDWRIEATSDCRNISTTCQAVLDVVLSREVSMRSSSAKDRDPGYQYFWCRRRGILNSTASCLEGLNFVSSAGHRVLPD